MAKNQAQTELHVRRLHEALAKIPDLRALPKRAYDPEFELWKGRVKQSLTTIFGPLHDYPKRFARLSFMVPQFHMDTRWSPSDEDEYSGDLTIAENLLRDALEEVQYAPQLKESAAPAAPHHLPAPVVVNVMNVLSQATNVSVSQLLASTQFMSLPADVREKAAAHAKDLDEEIRGQQRWPVLAKSLEALKSLGKGAYDHVALPLLLDMLKKQAGL